MNARLERKLRLLAVIIAAGTFAGLAINFAQGRTSPSSMVVGVTYGLLMCVAIGSVELFVLDGPLRAWLGGLSFTVNLIVRSAIYAAIIMVIQLSQSGEIIAGLPLDTSRQNFWFGFIYSAAVSVLMNLGFGIANIIGPRAFLNFITGRYHSRSRKTALCFSSTSRDRPGSPSGSAGSLFTVFLIVLFVCSPLRSWIIAGKC
jgi:adenylate cyclase